MRKVILMLLAINVSVTAFTQEIDYNKLAGIFDKKENQSFINQLKKVSKEESGLTLLKSLMNTQKELDYFIKEKKESIEKTNKIMSEINSQIENLHTKLDNYYRESKRLGREREIIMEN
ncbi:MAG: hypothetical protein HWD85_00585 [Flavobacteriaceae bacterium]|nr:hypothetical protein [Flavobacteriaceae bacterium]